MRCHIAGESWGSWGDVFCFLAWSSATCTSSSALSSTSLNLRLAPAWLAVGSAMASVAVRGKGDEGASLCAGVGGLLSSERSISEEES